MSILCDLFGHKPDGQIHNVYGLENQMPKWRDELGNGILYHMRLCCRCNKRIPVSAEDAAEKQRVTDEIAAVMNGERARFGLKPISWDD